MLKDFIDFCKITTMPSIESTADHKKIALLSLPIFPHHELYYIFRTPISVNTLNLHEAQGLPITLSLPISRSLCNQWYSYKQESTVHLTRCLFPLMHHRNVKQRILCIYAWPEWWTANMASVHYFVIPWEYLSQEIPIDPCLRAYHAFWKLDHNF